MVTLGAATLLIEANRSYNASLSSTQFSEHPILRDMKIADLCTRREKNSGFIFYSFLYLITYALILSSAEIYELVRRAEATGLEVGPIETLAGTASEADSLFGATYAKPIYVSASIIAIFSSGVLSPIENMMRSLAHRLSGVPRGVYEVIDQLHRHSFSVYRNENPSALLDMFEENAKPNFENSFEKGYIRELENLLSAIDQLSPTLTGKQRVRHFPLTQLDAMKSMSTALEVKIAKLRRMLSSKTDNNDDARQELYDYVKEVSNDSVALFAVHFIRNNRAIKNSKENKAISVVESVIKEEYRFEANSLLMAFVFSLALCSMMSGFLYYKSIADTSDSLYAAVVRNNQGAIENICGPNLKKSLDYAYNVDPRFDSLGQGVLNVSSECLEKLKAADNYNSAERIRWSTIKGLTEPLTILMGVAAAAIVALFIRDVRIEDGSWRNWTPGQPAFIQFLSTSILPSGMATLGVASTELLRSWLESGVSMTQSDLAFFFQSKGLFFLMQAPTGFVASVGVLALSDFYMSKRAPHVGEKCSLIPAGLVVSLGIVSVVLYAIIIMVSYPETFKFPLPEPLRISYGTRELLVYGTVPAIFLFSYTMFLSRGFKFSICEEFDK